MKKLSFEYNSRLTIDGTVKSHTYLLRFLPRTQPGQQILSLKWHINGDYSRKSEILDDAFGNRTVSGRIAGSGSEFTFGMTGIAFTDCTARSVSEPQMCLKYATPLTEMKHSLELLHRDLAVSQSLRHEDNAGPADTRAGRYSKQIMQLLSEKISYVPGSTCIGTTAEEAARAGKGVCQDYAHIMLALLRAEKIPCRYVTGLIPGEGVTHAWVEVYDGSCWQGYDPTHNCLADEGYIKISHGPDSTFCAIEHGVFSGIAAQQQFVSAKVTEL